MSTPLAEMLAPSALAPASGRAVAAARRLSEVLLRATFADDLELGAIADELELLVGRLEEHAPAARTVALGLSRGERYSLHDPVSGAANPLAPPVEVQGLEDGSVAGSVRLGLLHQGPPGLVHGGVLAMVLDHVLALANSWAGTIGMTGRLEVSYLRPTPLFVDLEVTARQQRLEGRKILTTGEITVDGEPCVRASALFVAFPNPSEG